jgi:hypothetical protein
MRRHSDDDLYRIHSRWLGPAGYTLPFSIPLNGIPAGAGTGVVALAVLRAVGVSGLPLWALTTGMRSPRWNSRRGPSPSPVPQGGARVVTLSY